MSDHHMTFDDGTTIALVEFRGFIEHVRIPWAKSVTEQLDNGGASYPRDDEEAVVTSILVLPDGTAGCPPDQLGTLSFHYNTKLQFGAPVVALQDRYHGLRNAQQLLDRFRLVVDPTVVLDPSDAFAPAMRLFRVRCLLDYWLQHEAPDGRAPIDGFTVEVQGLIKSNKHQRPGLFTRK